MMDYSSFIDDILADWILHGGDFEAKVDQHLAEAEISEDGRRQIRCGSALSYRILQTLNLDRLRQMSEPQLRAELTAMFRW